MATTLPSPLALLRERDRMVREEEAPTGRLRLPHWSRPPRVRAANSSTWAPVHLHFRGSKWGNSIDWEGPVARMRLARDTRAGLDDIELVSNPPRVVHMQNRILHCEDGPAVAWEDGTQLFFLRGIEITRDLFERLRSGRLTALQVLRIENQSIMAVLMEQLGWDAVLKGEHQVEKLDHHDRWGTLYRITEKPRLHKVAWQKEPIMSAPRWSFILLRVINRSPEPDGSHRVYWLQCDMLLRPLRRDGTLGDPQEMTSLNAVASTFDMRGAEYERLLGQES